MLKVKPKWLDSEFGRKVTAAWNALCEAHAKAELELQKHALPISAQVVNCKGQMIERIAGEHIEQTLIKDLSVQIALQLTAVRADLRMTPAHSFEQRQRLEVAEKFMAEALHLSRASEAWKHAHAKRKLQAAHRVLCGGDDGA